MSEPQHEANEGAQSGVSWRLYAGTGNARETPITLPEPPPWRAFKGEPLITRVLQSDRQGERKLGRGESYRAGPKEVDMVNAALHLCRPLLIEGKPGTGKSSLAYAVARELGFGPVLRWSITSRSTLQHGLYAYDAIARLQEAGLQRPGAASVSGGDEAGSRRSRIGRPHSRHAAAPSIGRFIRLGPLGTALLPTAAPRVLLIDELDKSDIDLPNDLLNVFEEGEYTIPELQRLADQRVVRVLPYDGEDPVPVHEGRVQCHAFPVVFITSNGERDFSGPFLRRCVRLTLEPPNAQKLKDILEAHALFRPEEEARRKEWDRLLNGFAEASRRGDLATDQLMNAMLLLGRGVRYAEREEGGDERDRPLMEEVRREKAVMDTVLRDLKS